MNKLIRPSPFLRNVLRADALISAVSGAAMVFGAALLAPLTRLPEPLLIGAGLALVPFVAFVLWLSSRAIAPVALVWAVIVMNVVWAIDCAWVGFGAGLAPSKLGLVFLALQAITVLVLAELEFAGLRRGARLTMA